MSWSLPEAAVHVAASHGSLKIIVIIKTAYDTTPPITLRNRWCCFSIMDLIGWWIEGMVGVALAEGVFDTRQARIAPTQQQLP